MNERQKELDRLTKELVKQMTGNEVKDQQEGDYQIAYYYLSKAMDSTRCCTSVKITGLKYHITKEGNKIKLSDLELYHLKNIIKWIERKAAKGATFRSGGGTCAEDMWYDEDTYYGEEALKKLKYYDYKAELGRR